jgi:hypothetical protein
MECIGTRAVPQPGAGAHAAAPLRRQPLGPPLEYAGRPKESDGERETVAHPPWTRTLQPSAACAISVTSRP